MSGCIASSAMSTRLYCLPIEIILFGIREDKLIRGQSMWQVNSKHLQHSPPFDLRSESTPMSWVLPPRFAVFPHYRIKSSYNFKMITHKLEYHHVPLSSNLKIQEEILKKSWQLIITTLWISLKNWFYVPLMDYDCYLTALALQAMTGSFPSKLLSDIQHI